MSGYINSTSRTFAIDRITHANVFPDQIAIFPVDYRMVMLTGADAKLMTEALREAGFVGDTTLVNVKRISVVEEAGANLKLYLEGADRVVMVARQHEKLLFPAPESTLPDNEPPKARRSKKATP